MSKAKTLAPSSIVTHKDPKGLKLLSVVEGQYDKAQLSEDEAQRVNDTPGLADLIRKFIAESRLPDKYKGEEAKSSYTYPQEYSGPKPIEKQIELLLGYFPGLDPELAFRYMRDVYGKLELPDWVEGPFAVPNEYILAQKFYPEVQGRPTQYCAGVNLVIGKIAGTRTLYNYREGQIVPDQFQRQERTAEMLDCLIEIQDGSDIIILPTQLGLRHRGRSTRRVLEICISTPEFGGGSLEFGTILLTHPERLVRWEQLHVDLPGDKFRETSDGGFDRAPYFNFDDDGAEFDTGRVSSAVGGSGSFSVCLPQ